MRYFLKFVVTLGFLSGTINGFARGTSVTLNSGKGDKVTISYNVVGQGNSNIISFSRDVVKAPSLKHRDDYKIRDLRDVKVLFFDRTGGYKDAVFDAEMPTNAFLVDRDKINYKRSADGYFFLEDSPELTIDLLSDETVTLSIPIYLALYEKKGRYKVIANCGNLDIPLSKKMQGSNDNLHKGAGGTQTVSKTITTKEEVEGESELSADLQVAKSLIEAIVPMLNRGYVDDQLKDAMDQLKPLSWKPEVDAATRDKIQELITRFNSLKESSDQRNEQNAKNKAEEEVRETKRKQAQSDLAYVKERLSGIDQLPEADQAEFKSAVNQLRRQSYEIDDEELANNMRKTADECDKKFTEIESSKKRRNIWLIVGGVLLAVLMFVGNQSFQHFRNLQSQKGIENMQKSIAKRAENEARRRAESAVRSRVNKVQGEVRQKSRDAVRNGVKNAASNVANGVKKGNKKVSI